MKLFWQRKKEQASHMVLSKYPYEKFLLHKEKRHTDALVERMASEIHLKLSDKNIKQ